MSDYLEAFVPPIVVDPTHAALLIVDMQYASTSRDHGLGARLRERGRVADGTYRFDRIERLVVPNLQRLLAVARRGAVRVVYLTVGSEVSDFSDLPLHMRAYNEWVGNVRGRREHEILDELCPLETELVLNKVTTGGFSSSSLDACLRALGVTDLLIAGVSTNSCVETTARDAADRGYRTVLIDDACAAARPELHEATLTSFRRFFGRVATTDELIAELGSGTSP